MRSWIAKQVRKIKNVTKKEIELKIDGGNKGLVEAMGKYFEILTEQLVTA